MYDQMKAFGTFVIVTGRWYGWEVPAIKISVSVVSATTMMKKGR